MRVRSIARYVVVMVFALGLFAVQGGVVRAELLKVDFDCQTSGVTEAGFDAFQRTYQVYTDVTAKIKGYDVRLVIPTGNAGCFYRDVPATTPFSNLYRDFAYSNTPTVPVSVYVSGLGKSTEYDVRVYSFDYDGGGNVTATMSPIAGTTGSAISIAYNGSTLPTTADQYSAVARWKTDSNGMLAFSSQNAGRINGFTISEVPTTPSPEPSAFILVVTGLIGLACYAWRRAK